MRDSWRGSAVDGRILVKNSCGGKALSDGPNSWPLHKMKELLTKLVKIDKIVKNISDF